jgi:hypothetical protein
MKTQIKRTALNILPYVKNLIKERDKLRLEENHWRHYSKSLETWARNGHFYSPYADLENIRKHEKRIFSRKKREFAGINLNESLQVENFHKLAQFYKDIPFKDSPQPGLRYYYDNFAYSYTDGIVLHSMIRLLKPKRIIEIGSGFSSCVTLDTNELFFNNKIDVSFVEPYPELLLSLVKSDDKLNLNSKNLEDIDLEYFKKLKDGDILFIDSTHVSKVNSDVNYIFFELLPSLNKGVVIHFHDIFYPFEYPKEWIYEGRAWTEDYLLRAFLEFNDYFEITYWASFIHEFYSDLVRQKMPLSLKNKGGNFWMKKVK